ncbi:MAG: YIP1 family protein [Oceanococcaceae bacterium]
MTQIVDRMLRAARLDPALYEEVEHDSQATGQAVGVVVASALAAGVGGASTGGLGGLIGLTLAALLGWVLWAGIIYLIGAKVLPTDKTEATVGQLLRTLGFAQSPGLLRVLGFVPLLGLIVHFVVGIWMLCSMVVAVRAALDYDSTGRAIGVVLLGFLAYMLTFGLVAGALGIGV